MSNDVLARYAREWRANNRERDRANRARHDMAHPESRMLANAKNRAASKKLEYDLTPEWVQERLVKGVCEVTGLPFDLARGSTNQHNPFRPSIDRKDSSVGYTKANCQVVVWIYNCAKGSWAHEDVVTLVKALSKKEVIE